MRLRIGGWDRTSDQLSRIVWFGHPDMIALDRSTAPASFVPPPRRRGIGMESIHAAEDRSTPPGALDRRPPNSLGSRQSELLFV
jgi:hypothetical protein